MRKYRSEKEGPKVAKQPEALKGQQKCLVCKGRLASGLYPICQKPFCYNRTVSLFESYGHIKEIFASEGKKGGIPDAPPPQPEAEDEQ